MRCALATAQGSARQPSIKQILTHRHRRQRGKLKRACRGGHLSPESGRPAFATVRAAGDGRCAGGRRAGTAGCKRHRAGCPHRTSAIRNAPPRTRTVFVRYAPASMDGRVTLKPFHPPGSSRDGFVRTVGGATRGKGVVQASAVPSKPQCRMGARWPRSRRARPVGTRARQDRLQACLRRVSERRAPFQSARTRREF